jgi:hypothetical protein
LQLLPNDVCPQGTFGLGAHVRQRGKPRRPEKPAGQNGFVRNPPGLLRQDDENRLRDFPGQVRVAHLPQRRGIDKSDAPRNEFRESRFGVACRVFPQQRHVVHRLHSPLNAGFGRNRTGFLQKFY